MGCRGVLFAIDDDTTAQLLAADSDEAVMEIVEASEEEWVETFLEELTRHGMQCTEHSATVRSIQRQAGPHSIARSLGGKHVHRGEQYIVALVTKDEVPAVARALASIDEQGMRQRYRQLVPHDYATEYGDGSVLTEPGSELCHSEKQEVLECGRFRRRPDRFVVLSWRCHRREIAGSEKLVVQGNGASVSRAKQVLAARQVSEKVPGIQQLGAVANSCIRSAPPLDRIDVVRGRLFRRDVPPVG